MKIYDINNAANKNDELLKKLADILSEQNHRIAALWAFELAQEAVKRVEEKYPDELRPRYAEIEWLTAYI